MKREEDWLREACGELAEEETDQLARSLSPDEMRQAETLYRRHRKTALSLIRRKSARSVAAPYLRAAAILALLAGAVYFSLRQSQPDKVPLTQAPAISMAPYYTDVPSPVPGTSEPTAAPTLERVPTPTPVPPTATPAPTPSPTPSPSPTRSPLCDYHPPLGWTGNYFPDLVPTGGYGGFQAAIYIEDDSISTVFFPEESDWEFRFTEYASSVAVAVPEDAAVSYVQISEEIIALRTETAEGITLTWDQEGQTLSLSISGHPLDGDALLTSAQSVEKVTADWGWAQPGYVVDNRSIVP